MRALLITPDLFSRDGGIARIMRLYLQALAAGGSRDRVSYATLLDVGDTAAQARRFAGEQLGEHRNAAGSRPRFVRQVLELAARADHLVCGHVHLLPVAWLAQQLNPAVRYSLVAHGIEVWRPFTWVEQQALVAATRIFCVSRYTRQQLRRFCPALAPDRLVVLPNSFDPRFASCHDPAAGRDAQLRGAGSRLLTVARLDAGDAYKGIDTLIEAMPRVLARHPQATLRVVGSGNDRRRLEALTHERRLEDCVIFLGTIDDDALAREYSACDIFALPSAKEGFGLVYLEAMSHSKPCLAANAGGAPEVVNTSVGTLVDYGDPDQIARGIDRLIRHPRSAAAIRAHVELFAFDRFSTALLAHLPAT